MSIQEIIILIRTLGTQVGERDIPKLIKVLFALGRVDLSQMQSLILLIRAHPNVTFDTLDDLDVAFKLNVSDLLSYDEHMAMVAKLPSTLSINLMTAIDTLRSSRVLTASEWGHFVYLIDISQSRALSTHTYITKITVANDEEYKSLMR
jgi:hypothetical protein